MSLMYTTFVCDILWGIICCKCIYDYFPINDCEYIVPVCTQLTSNMPINECLIVTVHSVNH